jgi:hypothetical protein
MATISAKSEEATRARASTIQRGWRAVSAKTPTRSFRARTEGVGTDARDATPGPRRA